MPDPRRDEAGLHRLIKYLERPRTIAAIQERFDLSERSAYRWVEYLKEQGVRVVVERGEDVTYMVLP